MIFLFSWDQGMTRFHLFINDSASQEIHKRQHDSGHSQHPRNDVLTHDIFLPQKIDPPAQRCPGDVAEISRDARAICRAMP
jgi:hypothetical protein